MGMSPDDGNKNASQGEQESTDQDGGGKEDLKS